MKKTLNTNYKWILSGLLGALMILLMIAQTGMSSAHPVGPEGNQSDFAVTDKALQNGGTGIESQETNLDIGYFADNGQRRGVTVTPVGLVLVTEETIGTYESGIIHSPLAFTTDIVPLWGANLPDGTTLRLETRLSFDGGDSWSEWLENPEAFYPVRDNLYGGNLIWAGSNDLALQFRVTLQSNLAGDSPTLNSLVLIFNDTSQGPTDAEIAQQMAGASAASDSQACPVSKPSVVSRTEWGNPEGQNSPRRPPVYQPVTHIIIHHTVTPNHTQPYQDFAGWVRSIWNYHANILWWGDVGYNFLIDPNGVIYEGRAGGDDVVGIHDRFNRGSMAIGFIGCYGNCNDPRLTAAEPSESMLASAEELMAWKLGQKQIDPLSSGPYAGLNDVPVIAGGRDVVMTASPGDNLYNKLPDLRAAVAERANCQPPPPDLPACQIQDIIFDKEQYLVNDTIGLTIRLIDHNGNPLPGALVRAGVEKPEVNTQATSDFNLVDRVGEYDGNFSDTDIAGEYLFMINASDPTGERFAACSAQAAVQVNSETAPIANDDTITTTVNTAVIINVAANDTDPDGNLNPDSVTVVSQPAHGSAQKTGPGQITYTPNAGFTGTDSFTYRICDTDNECDTATVTVTVTGTGTNHPPVANDDTITTTVNTAVIINVAANDTDPDGNLNPDSVTVVSQPTYGSAQKTGSGQITYTPNAGFTGNDNFTYQICDTDNECDTATVTVTVTPMASTSTVRVVPALLQLGLNQTKVTTVEVTNISDLWAVEIELAYDPNVVEVVDADPSKEGIQVGLGEMFEGVENFVAKNEVSNGVINFSGTRLAPAPVFEGTGSIIEITWRGKSQGQTDVNLNEVKLANPNGMPLTADSQNGQIEVTSSTQVVVKLRGKVELQGNSDSSSSITITSGDRHMQPDPDGTFEMALDSAASYLLTLTAPGYLSARAEAEVTAGSTTIDIGSVILLAGDVTGDDVIDIFDLAYMASHYQEADPLADLNADGIVDILDLALAANNYQQQGPLTNWQ